MKAAEKRPDRNQSATAAFAERLQEALMEFERAERSRRIKLGLHARLERIKLHLPTD
jgi:hypothetical protein